MRRQKPNGSLTVIAVTLLLGASSGSRAHTSKLVGVTAGTTAPLECGRTKKAVSSAVTYVWQKGIHQKIAVSPIPFACDVQTLLLQGAVKGSRGPSTWFKRQGARVLNGLASSFRGLGAKAKPGSALVRYGHEKHRVHVLTGFGTEGFTRLPAGSGTTLSGHLATLELTPVNRTHILEFDEGTRPPAQDGALFLAAPRHPVVLAPEAQAELALLEITPNGKQKHLGKVQREDAKRLAFGPRLEEAIPDVAMRESVLARAWDVVIASNPRHHTRTAGELVPVRDIHILNTMRIGKHHGTNSFVFAFFPKAGPTMLLDVPFAQNARVEAWMFPKAMARKLAGLPESDFADLHSDL